MSATEIAGKLTIAGIAARTGMKEKTIRHYHYRAERNRRENNPRPGDLPQPTTYYGRVPVWSPRVIDRWWASRPGRGAGGGRPVGFSPARRASTST